MTKKFPLWINNCHIFAHFVQFWPCYFFSMPFYGRQPTWHEKLVKICGIANFLNFNLAKSNFWLVAICPIKRHLDYLFRMEEVLGIQEGHETALIYSIKQYFLHSEKIIQMPLNWANGNQSKIWFCQIKIQEISNPLVCRFDLKNLKMVLFAKKN